MTGFQAGHFSRDFNDNRDFDNYMLQNMFFEDFWRVTRSGIKDLGY